MKKYLIEFDSEYIIVEAEDPEDINGIIEKRAREADSESNKFTTFNFGGSVFYCHEFLFRGMYNPPYIILLDDWIKEKTKIL